MKKLLIMIVIFFMAAAANAFEIEGKTTFNIYNDSGLSSNEGYEVRVRHKQVFLFCSYDRTYNRFCGQEAGTVDLIGAGIGLERRLSKRLSVWGAVGYYMPDNTMEDRVMSMQDKALANYESLMRELQLRVDEKRVWKYYEYELDPNIGAMIGIDFIQPLRTRLNFKMSASYRYLRFSEAIYGYDTYIGDPGGWWEHFQERDFSSFNIGAAFEYRF